LSDDFVLKDANLRNSDVAGQIGRAIMQTAQATRLLLASTSRYRAELLGRLGLPFDIAAPNVDETPFVNEHPEALALRLSIAKAAALAKPGLNRLVIGSDQALALGDQKLGKPGDHANATIQLRRLSGQTVVFYTGLCVIDSETGRRAQQVVPVTVTFRSLDDATIERYLKTEQPYDCAGSAKSEALGIALLQRIDNADPTALIGLPMIALSDCLQQLGFDVLEHIGQP
jgi:septum formation protein